MIGNRFFAVGCDENEFLDAPESFLLGSLSWRGESAYPNRRQAILLCELAASYNIPQDTFSFGLCAMGMAEPQRPKVCLIPLTEHPWLR